MTSRPAQRRISTAIAVAVALGAAAVAVVATQDSGEPFRRLPVTAWVVHVQIVGDAYALDPRDRLFALGTVLVGRSRRRIGLAAFACTVSGADRSRDGACDVTLHLPLGRITGRWPLMRSDRAGTMALTGGSGIYRGARGRFVLGRTSRDGATPFTVDVAR